MTAPEWIQQLVTLYAAGLALGILVQFSKGGRA